MRSIMSGAVAVSSSDHAAENALLVVKVPIFQSNLRFICGRLNTEHIARSTKVSKHFFKLTTFRI